MLITLRVNLFPLIQRQTPSNASLCLLLYPLQEEKKEAVPESCQNYKLQQPKLL